MKTKFRLRMISCALVLILAFSVFPFSVFASESEPLYVNLGDSIAWGRIENEEQYEYNYDLDSYSGLFASYLGTTRTSYARRGMQTTDVLYMIDEDFRNGIDGGRITADCWWHDEYPPFDTVPLEQVNADIAKADYISLCIGVCDYISYPGDVKTTREGQLEEQLGNSDEALARLKELLAQDLISEEVYAAFKTLLNIYEGEALILLNYVIEILEGYLDYSQYYGRIVKDLRDANKNGTIFLLGTFLTGDMVPFLQETPDASPIIFYINRLLDNINLIVKNAAAQYDCLYVDTMGVESAWHPTVNGHQQICERMISVLEGQNKYSGGVEKLSLFSGLIACMEKIKTPIVKVIRSSISIPGKIAASLLATRLSK